MSGRFEEAARPSRRGRQPRFPMFAESSPWKCETFDANDSLRASLRTHTIGQDRKSGPHAQFSPKRTYVYSFAVPQPKFRQQPLR